MKKTTFVYVVESVKEETTIIYSSLKKAKARIEKHSFPDNVFDMSKKEDMYISKRMLF